MKPKKNPRADLTKNSGLYFLIGLTSVLLITYLAFEWKTGEGRESIDLVLNLDATLDDETPITQAPPPKQPPPPPPPAPPDIIDVVDDDADVEELEIKSTEIDKDEVVDISDIEDFTEEVDVPFAVIEEVPVFPGCERKPLDKRKLCFQQKIMKHINKHFEYPEIAKEMNIQGRVNVIFTIAKNGSIKNIRSRGPDKSLQKEAERIIGKLPHMKPGKQRGEPVRVSFAIPITFKLQN